MLEEALGSSSWRATDTELERQVLVRFRPAGELAWATLSHPSIARVFDQGEADGERYAVLEFLPGGTLEERLPELGESEAREAAADIAAALEYAHAQGVVHGSLSLANVLLDGEGRAKVAGFGGSGTPEEDMQALGAILASLAEVAPAAAEEQTAVIAPARAAGRRTGVLVTAAAITLLVAGVSAAFLMTGDSTTDVPTGSLSVPVPSQTTAEETEAPPPQPTETAETTTTTKATTTTEPEPTTAPTTAPPPATTLPPPLPTTVELPPTTTEELPPITTETTPIEPP